MSDRSSKQGTVKRKRCPKGKRRNEAGECVPISVFQVEQSTRTRKRCPKGTHRNELGECVPTIGSVSTTTRRIEKPVLLGNSELVQFSFNNARLTTFEPIVSDSPTSALSWLNAVYALGLINTRRMQKETMENSRNTISPKYANYNIQDMFGSKIFIHRSHIIKRGNDDTYLLQDIESHENIIEVGYLGEDVNQILKDHLQDNHATIISFFCVDRTHFPAQDTWYHYLIAFKSKWNDEQGDHEEVELYDPQNKVFLHDIGKFFGYERISHSIHRYVSRRELETRKKEIYYITYFTFASYGMPKQNVPLKSTIPSFMYDSDSPLITYTARHFTVPIKVLGRHSLFQVSFTPQQFEKYSSITYYKYDKKFQGGSCVIHALFSLGLRHVTEAKKDVQIMDYRSKNDLEEGISSKVTAKYIEQIMKLPKGSVKVWTNKCVDTTVEDELKRSMNVLLENNHATIFNLYFYNNDKKTYSGHAVVAYKRDGIVEYFDPQFDKKIKNKASIESTMKQYGNLKLIDFSTYHFTNYKTQEDVLIDDTSCRLKLGDSRSSNDSHSSKRYISFDREKDYPTNN